MDDNEDCNIRVICRFRPVNKRELEEGGGLAKQITFPTDKQVEVASFNGRGPQSFNFDKIFYDPLTTQEDVYELAAKKSIEDVIKGYNSTIFAYGQTGAGKSFTMFGDINILELKGIIPRSCMHIFDHISRDRSGTEYTIKCSFLEIYKEIVRDLLNPGQAGKQGLKIREAPGRGVWVEGLHEAYVACERDVLDLIQKGESQRAVSSTNMNATSSRSHSLFILILHQKSPDGSTKEGKLNLADLAGSEKVGKTGATGDTLEEAKKINQSLSALGNCINALTKAKKTHVPYRDSKLTFILRESLGGNCKTTLLIACSPHIFNLEETVSTLMFGKRAKTIKNSVKMNAQRSVAELLAIIDKLKKELTFYKKYVPILEQELEKIKGPNWKADLPKIAQQQQATTQEEPSKTDQSKDSSDEEPEEPDEVNNQTEQQTPVGETIPEQPEPSDKKPSDENGMKLKLKRKNSNHKRVPSAIKEEEVDVYSSSVNMSLKLAEIQVELQRLKEKTQLEILDLTEENKNLTKDNNSLSEKLKKKKELITNLENQIKSNKDELEAQKSAKENLEEKLKYEIKQLTFTNESQKEATEKLQMHLTETKEKAESYLQQVESKTTEMEQLLRDKLKLHRDYEESAEQIKLNQNRINELELNLKEYEKDYSEVREQNMQKEITNKALQSKIDLLEEKYKNLIQTSRDTESKLIQAISEKQALETQLADMTTELQSLQEELKENKEIIENNQKLESQLKEAGKEQVEQLLKQTVPISQYEIIQKEKEKMKETYNSLLDKYKLERETSISYHKQVEELNLVNKNNEENWKLQLETQKEEYDRKLNLVEGKLEESEDINSKKIRSLEEKSSASQSLYEQERVNRTRIESEMEEFKVKFGLKEKEIRSLHDKLFEQSRSLDNQIFVAQNQLRSLEAQTERIKQLEEELEGCRQDKAILQQEVKTAVEINIENARKFEQQLNMARQETRLQPTNIRVPVKSNEPSFLGKLFGKHAYPLLQDVKPQVQYGFLLAKGSSWYNRWKKRFFVLTDKQQLCYFDSNLASARAEAIIELADCTICPAEDITGKANTIKILFNKQKDELFLQAPNEAEHFEWLCQLQNAIEEAGKRVHPIHPAPPN